MSAAFVLAAVSTAFAQGNGIGGITEATNMVTSYFDPGTKLIYAIGAVVGLIGRDMPFEKPISLPQYIIMPINLLLSV